MDTVDSADQQLGGGGSNIMTLSLPPADGGSNSSAVYPSLPVPSPRGGNSSAGEIISVISYVEDNGEGMDIADWMRAVWDAYFAGFLTGRK